MQKFYGPLKVDVDVNESPLCLSGNFGFKLAFGRQDFLVCAHQNLDCNFGCVVIFQLIKCYLPERHPRLWPQAANIHLCESLCCLTW